MTVSTVINRVSYAGNGVSTAFAFPYPYLAKADLVALLVEDATGTSVTQALTTNYTLTSPGPAGGTLTMLVAPPTGYTLVIYRDPAITQTTDWTDGDNLPAASIENAMDRQTMISLRLRDLVDRSFRLPDSDTSGASVLLPAPKADKALVWNNAGNALENADIAALGAVTLPLTVAQGGTNAITAADARTSLGALASDADNITTVVPVTSDLLLFGDASDSNNVKKATITDVLALGSATDEKAKVSSNDTTAGYLNGKLVAGSGISFTENNDGGNETLTIAASGSSGATRNYVINGSFKLAQRAMPTADNVYALDRWRMLTENANGYVVTQDTADIPTGATHACKMVVGAGNNGKFGIWQVLESIDCKELAGQTVSILVPIKATAGIADVRIGIVAFTSTADSVSGDPISAWGAAGTNPTLAANYAFQNTPANITPTTSWADYTVVNVSITASMTNLAIFIWNDDRTTTTTTDILRVGGYVTLCKGATAPSAQVRGLMEEYELCKRYCQKTFALGSAPAQNFGTTGALSFFQLVGSSAADVVGPFYYPSGRMRSAPTITTYNPSANNAQARGVATTADCSATSPQNICDSSFSYGYTSSAGSIVTGRNIIHFLFEAEL